MSREGKKRKSDVKIYSGVLIDQTIAIKCIKHQWLPTAGFAQHFLQWLSQGHTDLIATHLNKLFPAGTL